MSKPPEQSAGQGRQWSSRSVGRNWQHQIFYLLIRLGGRRTAYLLLYLVVGYYVLCSRSARAKAGYYLKRRFPNAEGLRRLWLCYRLILELGKVLIDRAVVGILGPESMAVSLEGRKELLELLAEGKGLVMVTAHVGCWQVAMSALDFMNKPVNMLMRREDGDLDRDFYEHAGIDCPYQVIDPTGYLGGTLEMMGVLKQGQVLCVMGDRLLGSDKSATRVDFLGGKVAFPFSAYKIASATGAPMVVFYSWKSGPASYRLKLARIIRVPQLSGRDGASFRPYVDQFAAALQEFVEEQPFQFFNFFDMWHESNHEQDSR